MTYKNSYWFIWAPYYFKVYHCDSAKIVDTVKLGFKELFGHHKKVP